MNKGTKTMNGLKKFAVMAAVAAITCPVQGSFAADAPKNAAAEPGFGIKKGDDRSISIDQLKAPSANATRITDTAKPATKPAAKKPAAQVAKAAAPAIKPIIKKPGQPPTVLTAKHPMRPVTPVAKKPVQANPVTSEPENEVATHNPSSDVQNVSNTTIRPEGAVVSAWLDRQGSSPKYKVGDKMVVNVTTSTDCNLVVFNYDAKGTLTQLFPNSYQPSGFVKAGESLQIGGPDSPFDYEITGKGGMERIFVYAYPTGTDAPITVAMNTVANSPFRSIEMPSAKYREMVNSSRVFFAREVKVVPKRMSSNAAPQTTPTPKESTTQMISNTTTTQSGGREGQPNKVELTFTVEGN
jgi:hypothetical protein